MLKDIVRSQYVTETSYELVFDDGHNNGFGFPCDANGNVSEDMFDAAKENYKYCLEHPEKFVRYNKIVKRYHRYQNPGHGTCSCGNVVELWDQYYGACECEKCGKWYNLYGQELVHPKYWEEDLEPEW